MDTEEHTWASNIGGFIRYYRPRGWLIRGRATGFGYSAQLVDEDRRPKGRPLEGLTLDELAARIEAAP